MNITARAQITASIALLGAISVVVIGAIMEAVR